MATINRSHVQLAKQLPPKLLRFLARFPPPSLTAASSQTPSTITSTTLNTSSSDLNANLEERTVPSTPSAPFRNPFLRSKNHLTGNWHDPKFSLRRQADLVKLARANGVEELLPLGPKSTEVKIRKREERGLRVKGTGVGQKVKGHWRERTLKGRLEERRQAMVRMPSMVREWKRRGHGRGWKKWPK
ncbi:MAG: hypothetical protein MMC23_007949 [Stictis urceolatum]|nr:hypothetical protein [Stictis urceolata]